MPLRGLEGAGDGGRSCPSKSILETALPRDFVDCENPSAGSPPGRSDVKLDILNKVYGAFVDGPEFPTTAGYSSVSICWWARSAVMVDPVRALWRFLG